MKTKTLSGLKKRIKKTGTGKYVHRSGGMNHNLGSKSNRRKRALKLAVVANDTQARRIKQLAPYK